MAVEAPTLPLRYALDETKGIPKEIEIAITALKSAIHLSMVSSMSYLQT